MKPLCLAANAAWLASSVPAALAFRANMDRAAEVQEEILFRILRRNGLGSIRTLREYRERFPVRTYDEYGEITASGVTHYEQTSGSSGAAKRIPHNRALRAEMARAIAPWIVDLFTTHPGAFAGEAYWSISPVLSSDASTISDEDHLGPMRAHLVRAVQAVPPDVRFIQDLDTFRRATLDHLLRCRQTLSLISVWHPSFLLLLLGDLREQAAALWPNLRVISCWTDAHAARDAAELARIFPRVHIQPKGLLSTEGFISIPIADAAAPALAYRSHFYELRCMESDRVLLATEGEVGKRYRVILTTSAGLYRYDTEDVIEIVGYRGTCPLLRFFGRTHHISDHYGEKLNEIFVRERLEAVLRAFDVVAAFAMLACEDNAYVLFIESAADEALLLDVVRALDDALRENVHYDYCRRLGQLDALRGFRIAHNASTTYLTHAGPRLGDVKLTALDSRGGWRGRFERA